MILDGSDIRPCTSAEDSAEKLGETGPAEGDRAIDPYDYISFGKTSEKVGCSIGSA